MDDERAAQEVAPRDGICVECGVLIPHERLTAQADTFRCEECTRSYEATRDPGIESLRRTA